MLKSQFSKGICLTFVILTLTFPNITAAEIKVYDNNNKYLGILLDMESAGGMTIFIPSINASLTFYEIEIHNPDSCTPISNSFIFESNDCSGTPYIQGSFPNARYNNCQPIDPGYYMPDTNSPGQFVPKSFLYGDINGRPACGEIESWPSYPFYEAKKIQLPFTTPIALPVRFENVAGTSDFFVIPVKKK
jgi:hypothetical protein